MLSLVFRSNTCCTPPVVLSFALRSPLFCYPNAIYSLAICLTRLKAQNYVAYVAMYFL
jgi:hypothetical protein